MNSQVVDADVFASCNHPFEERGLAGESEDISCAGVGGSICLGEEADR